MSYADMAADVSHLIRHRSLRGCTLLGHSMGGKTAMVTALTEPSLISRLVVADIAPVAYDHDYDQVLAALNGLRIQELASRAQADKALRTALPEAPMRNFLLQNLVNDDGSYRWRINLDAISDNVGVLTGFPALTEVQPNHLPTCFIYGGLSPYLQPKHQPNIKTLFPNAELKCVANAGHWLHAEKPHDFLASLTAFLESDIGD